MPSRLTPLVTDHFYHVYNRGVNKRNLFINKKDYIRAINLIRFYNYIDYPIRFSKFLLLSQDQRKEIWNRLKNTSNRNCEIVSYCLMPNHYHLLIKQNTENSISKFISNFQNSYTKYFNIKNDRTGHLFQGQFKSKLVESEEVLLHVSRYIHLNPYSAALVSTIDKLKNYPWSSLVEYLSSGVFGLVNPKIILSNFGNANSYVDFVLNNADYQKSLESIKHLTLE